MKKLLKYKPLLLLVAMSFAFSTFSQQTIKNTSNKQSQVASATDITDIQTAYSRINQTHLKSQSFKFESPGCVDGGLIVYMTDGDAIEKIIYSGSIGDGSWTTEFYFNASGKLVFYFDKLTGGAAAQKISTTEYRLYVKNDKSIRCMEGKKIVQADNKAMEYIQTAYKLFKAYKSRNFSAALCDE